MIIKKIMSLFLCLGVTSTYSADNQWEIDAAPYLWATNMHGSVQIGKNKLEVAQSFSDILKHFQGGGMLYFNAHKNKAGVFFNAMYSVLEKHQILKDITLGVHNKFGIFSAGGTYELFRRDFLDSSPKLAIELLAGARYTVNDTTLTIGHFQIANNQQWTDPIIGTRINYNVTKKWQTMLEGDIGGIHHHNSYNLQSYLGYKPSKPIVFNDLILYLGYRFLHQHYQTNNNDKLYAWNMDIKGPVIGFKAIF